LIFGPLQIEARIDQDPFISSQVTLWSQGGSEVIRGNLLVLPIDNSLLYVEPLFLRAENGQIPELKRVILAAGNNIVMRETLAGALAALFEDGVDEPILPVTATTSADAPPGQPDAVEDAPAVETLSDIDLQGQTVGELARRAADHYDAAQQALQRGDWSTYGQELQQMEAALEALVEVTRGQ
jgi:uncharacterized membrane protein (UPF0182 family)